VTKQTKKKKNIRAILRSTTRQRTPASTSMVDATASRGGGEVGKGAQTFLFERKEKTGR